MAEREYLGPTAPQRYSRAQPQKAANIEPLQSVWSSRRIGDAFTLAVDALQIEPVSKLKFPANREINREFCRFRLSCTIFAPNRQANSVACSKIPYAKEQGIFGGVTGNSIEGSGKLRTLNSDASERIASKASTFCITRPCFVQGQLAPKTT